MADIDRASSWMAFDLCKPPTRLDFKSTIPCLAPREIDSANRMQILNGASAMYTGPNLPTGYHAKSRSSNPKIGQSENEKYEN